MSSRHYFFSTYTREIRAHSVVIVSIFHEDNNGDGYLIGASAYEAIDVLGSGSTKAKNLPKKRGVAYVRLDKCAIVSHHASSQASVMVQPPASLVTVVDSMVSMSINEPLRPKPLQLSTTSTMNNPTFIDYILGGCEISLSVAIDFTGSNGDPRVPGTLHHQSYGVRNDYEKAILAIGNILSKFDSDQKFPVW